MSWRDRIAKAATDAIAGIKAFHSSPHDIDKFDLAKVGTGQGAQSFGHGIYLAEHPEVSGQGGQYWKEFMRKFPAQEQDAARFLSDAKFNREAAAQKARALLESHGQFTEGRSPDQLESLMAARARLEQTVRMLEGDKPVGPRTYEVNFRAKPEELLDWDKPIAGQEAWKRIDPKVRSAIDDAMDTRGMNVMSDVPDAYKGSELYKALTHHDVHEVLPAELPGSSWYTGNTTEPQHVSAYLRSLDIPGIRYLDQGSRPRAQLETRLGVLRDDEVYARANNVGMPDRLKEQITSLENHLGALPASTYNYVVNDPSKLDIMAKYGIVGGAPVGMGALAAQDQYGAQP